MRKRSLKEVIKAFHAALEPNFSEWLDSEEGQNMVKGSKNDFSNKEAVDILKKADSIPDKELTKLGDKAFDFQKQLKVGKKGEMLFMDMYGSKVEHICESGDIKGADFRMKDTGELIELKTDTYDMDKTPNLFIERYSDHNRESPGGPWQAKQKGATYFVYQFVKNKIIFWYNLDKMLELLEKHLSAKKVGFCFIRNKGWTASGYKINRKIVEDALIEIEE